MKRTRQRIAPERERILCEAEVVAGLKAEAASELLSRFGADARLLRKQRPDELPFGYSGDLAALGAVGKCNAIYLVQHFAIPRPAGLLGHQHLTRLLRQIERVRSLHDSRQLPQLSHQRRRSRFERDAAAARGHHGAVRAGLR